MAIQPQAERPLSPHLQIYRPVMTMVMSIAHRVTGAANYFGILLLVYWLLAAATVLALASACTATRLTTQAQLPPPLVERHPVRVGVYYSKEFREYVHKETRGQVDYEVTLGPAHVINLDWLLKAMFAEVVPVDDPTKAGEVSPRLALVLEPRFEEYSFLTPKDVAGEAFIVTPRRRRSWAARRRPFELLALA